MANTAFLTLPVPTISIVGGLDTAAVSGGVAFSLDGFGLVSAGSSSNSGVVLWHLPAMTMVSTGSGSAAVGMTLSAPALAITGSVYQRIDVTLTSPLLTLAVSGFANTVGSVLMSLPAMTMRAAGVEGGAMALDLPSMTIQVTGTPGVIGVVSMHLPVSTMAAAGVMGVAGSVTLEMPAFSMDAGLAHGVAMSMPAVSLEAVGQTGIIGTVAMRTRPLILEAATVPAYSGVVHLVDPAPQMSIAGTVGSVARVAMSLRSLALATEGYSGVVGTAEMALPIVRIDASGYAQHVGTVVLAMPVLQLAAAGMFTAPPATSYNTIAMHTETMALTSYDNYDFNSFALFNGVYLGANGDGIFALSGATDDGAAIQAAARTGLTDFGTSHLKRIDRCYVGYRADGNLVLRVTVEELTVRDYLVTATGKSGLHGNHVRLGKGVDARYWQYEIRNQDGADFSLDVMELKPTVLRRRVGGGNA